MPRRKIPPDAFDAYFSLGPRRSYETLAEKYGVTKRAVTKVAKREDWQGRLIKVEAEARAKSDVKKVETLEVVRDQHLKALRLVLGKGIEALMHAVIQSPMDAVRAIGLAVREIRVELGEPSERTAVSVESVIKREYERWLGAGEEGAPETEEAPEKAGSE